MKIHLFTGTIPDHLKDGRKVLILAKWGWESLSEVEVKPSWRVAEFNLELTFGDDCQYIAGWRSITSNPYKDYAAANPIAWVEIPEI